MWEPRQTGLSHQSEAESKLKYESLCIELQRMWNVKYIVMLVIISVSVIASKVLKKSVEAM
jgi:hypothetical protein